MSRIAIASPNIPSKTESFVKEHIKQVQPVIHISGGWLPYLANGKTIFQGPLKFNIIRGILKRSSPSIYKYFYFKALKRILEVFRITHLVCEYGVLAGNLTQLYQDNKKIGIIPIFHGFDAYEKETVANNKTKYKKLFQYSNSIVVVSKAMESRLIELDCPKSKIHVIPCGIDTKTIVRSTPYKPGKSLLFVGRLTPKKAPLKLIKTLRPILIKYQAHLSIIGEGEEREACESYVEEQKLQEYVKLEGRRPHDEVLQAIENSSIYVQYSLIPDSGDSEGSPVSIMEASALSIPVVSTYIGGIPDIVIHEKTGLLARADDPDSFANFVERLILDQEFQTTLSVNSREQIERNYDSKMLGKKILNLCTEK